MPQNKKNSLTKKTITDKNGKSTTVWVKSGEEVKTGRKPKLQEPIKSKNYVEGLEHFKKIAEEAKDAKDFREKSRNIKVTPETAKEFIKKYGEDPDKASKKYFKEHGSKSKIKSAIKKQQDKYDKSDVETGSKASKWLKKKGKGVVTSLKAEVKEWKEAGSGLKKLFTGKHKDISKHEMKAIGTVVLHMAMVGVGAISAVGAAAVAKKFMIGYIEHSGILRVGHALLFAKAEDEIQFYKSLNDYYESSDFEGMKNYFEKAEKDGKVKQVKKEKVSVKDDKRYDKYFLEFVDDFAGYLENEIKEEDEK